MLDNGVPDNNCNAFVIREDFQPHECTKMNPGPTAGEGQVENFKHMTSTVYVHASAFWLSPVSLFDQCLSCQCVRYVYCDCTKVAGTSLKCRLASFCTAERMSVKHIKSVKGKQNKRRRSNIHKVVLVFF